MNSDLVENDWRFFFFPLGLIGKQSFLSVPSPYHSFLALDLRREVLNGESTVLRYIGRLATNQGAYGQGDAVSAARVDEYLAVFDAISKDESILDHVLKQMNVRLALDSFLVG